MRVAGVVWRLVRSVWRSFLFLMLLVAAVVDHWIRRPKWGAEGAVWIHGWCRRIVRVLGFRCEVEGRIPAGGAVVSNHLSYLDILLYSSVRPFVMVAKTEVRGWPLLGWLTAQAGTVYVERGGGPKTYPASECGDGGGLPERIAGAVLSGGDDYGWSWCASVSAWAVSLGAGQRGSAADCGAALHVGCRMRVNGGATVGEDVCWWGEMGFTSHIFRLLGLRGLRAQLRFGEEVVERADRFVLSETAQARVAEMYAELSSEASCGGGTACRRGRELLGSCF